MLTKMEGNSKRVNFVVVHFSAAVTRDSPAELDVSDALRGDSRMALLHGHHADIYTINEVYAHRTRNAETTRCDIPNPVPNALTKGVCSCHVPT